MLGAVSTPSGEIVVCTNTRIRTIRRVVQIQLEKYMQPSVLQDNLSNLPPGPHRYSPLSQLFMPLQPRRTWSAEDERRRRLEEDSDAYDVGPHSVTCAGCHRPIRLNATGRYYAANWNKHKMGCKNTNAVNGAGAMSAESKFTGRVAAFRVTKPAEMSESLVVSTFSSNPASHAFCRGHVQTSRQSDVHPSFAEQLPSRVDHIPRSSSCQPHGQLSEATGMTCNRLSATSFHDTAYAYSQPAPSEVAGASACQPPLCLNSRSYSDSPTGPTLRFEEQEVYGPTNSPLRAEGQREDWYSHAMPPPDIRRPREGLFPPHHSEDHHHRATFLHPREVSSGTQRISDKGKERYIHANSHVSRHRSSSQKDSFSSIDYSANDGHGWLINKTKNLDHHVSQLTTSEAGSPSNSARSWVEGHDLSDLDSTSATPSESSGRQLSRSLNSVKSLLPSVPSQSRNHIDERVLPPLSSLSLVQEGFFSGISSATDHYRMFGGKEFHADPDNMVSSEGSPVWRQRTRAWVRAATVQRALCRDSPESVVLPPIRSASMEPLEGPTGSKRRQGEVGEPDDDSMNDDRLSPPRGMVLPFGSSSSSSTLQADDLSFKYKRSDASLGKKTEVGGDSIFVGKQAQPYEDVSIIPNRDSGRLHPVWKWELKEDVPNCGGTEKGSDDATKKGNDS